MSEEMWGALTGGGGVLLTFLAWLWKYGVPKLVVLLSLPVKLEVLRQEFEDKTAKLDKENQELRGSNKNLSDKVELYQHRIKTLEDESAEQTRTIKNLNATIDLIQRQSAEKDKHIQQVEEDNRQRDIKMNSMQAQVDAQILEKVDLAEEKAKLHDQLRDITHELQLERLKVGIMQQAMDTIIHVKGLAAGEHKDSPPEPSPEASETSAPALINAPENQPNP